MPDSTVLAMGLVYAMVLAIPMGILSSLRPNTWIDTFGTVTSPRLDGGVDLEALTNYLGTFGPVDPPSTDRVNEIVP